MQTNLIGLGVAGLQQLGRSLAWPRYRADQVAHGIYQRRVATLADLTALPKSVRASLAETGTLERPNVALRQVSQDGTRKYLFRAEDGASFESVYIPTVTKSGRTHALCISSQTGCAVGCRFCFTASIRRNRDLAVAEILGQVLAVQDDGQPITNIVFMGMGEPLLNYDHVVAAARTLIDPKGFGFSSRRVTISTAGIVPRIYDLARDLPTQLAISLNATTDAVRDEIMPINRKWPIATLLQALRDFPLPPRRRFTIEYVLIDGVNDSDDDARRLVRLLCDLRAKVNLLPLNPHDETRYRPPEECVVVRFQEILQRAGVCTVPRTARGQDISAACGQLGRGRD
jgi:23S rRNA (adenine2503-C2)-methyltransferase